MRVQLIFSVCLISGSVWAQAGLPPVASPLPTAGENPVATRPLANEAPPASNQPADTAKSATPPGRSQAFEQRQRLFEQRFRQF